MEEQTAGPRNVVNDEDDFLLLDMLRGGRQVDLANELRRNTSLDGKDMILVSMK